MSFELGTDWDVVIIGAGAAGLFAAAAAAGLGARVLVLEKNRKIGPKILISGGTRCNLTHDCSFREVAAAFGHAERFLLSPLGKLTPQMVVDLIESLGVATYVEASTGKVFPRSDRALDVRDALWQRACRAGAKFLTGSAVRGVRYQEGRFDCQTDDHVFTARRLILTCGGLSYPGCGTTGDGYEWARQLGHTVTPTHPALTPLLSPASWVHELSGIAIDDTVAIALGQGKKIGYESRAATLFTHFGLSGPAPMNVSRFLTRPSTPMGDGIQLDLLPKLKESDLISNWRQQASDSGRQNLSRLDSFGLPNRLFERLQTISALDPQKRLAECRPAEFVNLAATTKALVIPISGSRGFPKAEVTAGGVALEEVDSRTMQSRRIAGLYLAGEILDLDGPIGGYNFQAAFATGDLAGLSAAHSLGHPIESAQEGWS